MTQELYVDALTRIAAVRGIAKLDLASGVPTTDGEVVLHVRHRLVIHPRNLASLYHGLQELRPQITQLASSLAAGAEPLAEAESQCVEVAEPVPESFADGFGATAVGAGMVRLDLVRLETVDRGLREERVASPVLRLVMPIQAFLESFHAIGAYLTRMGATVETAAVGGGDPAGRQVRGAASSPNFPVGS